mgnify:CR=1 FL=1|jgi:hypothetical protein
MQGRKYEVLMRRPSGPHKRVIVEDCYTIQEARQRAASMYGLEVIDAYPKS